MKRIIIILLLTGLLAVAGFAQDFNNPQVIEKLGLTQQQVEQLKLIYEEAQKTIREAQLDIDIHKAELKKLLFQSNVDLRQVERRLKSIVDLEYGLRLAQITREVNARKVIGDKTWALLNRMRTRTREEVGSTTRDRDRTQEPDSEHDSKSDSKQQ